MSMLSGHASMHEYLGILENWRTMHGQCMDNALHSPLLYLDIVNSDKGNLTMMH